MNYSHYCVLNTVTFVVTLVLVTTLRGKFEQESVYFSFLTGIISGNVYTDTGIDHLSAYQDDGHNMTHTMFKWGNQLEYQVIDDRINKKMYKSQESLLPTQIMTSSNVPYSPFTVRILIFVSVM